MHESNFEILSGLPPYGPMAINFSSNSEIFYSEGLVVKFFDSNGKDWIANFQSGDYELNSVIQLHQTTNLLIISGGVGYLFNPNERQIVANLGFGFQNLMESNGRIIMHDDIGLTIVESNGDFWDSRRIAMDGLKLLSIEQNVVSGLAYYPKHKADDEWEEFKFDIKTKKLIGGSHFN